MRRHVLCHAAPGAPHAFNGHENLEQPNPHLPHGGLNDQLDVVQTLSRLAPIHREVLVLFFFDDMPTAQMAEALDIARARSGAQRD